MNTLVPDTPYLFVYGTLMCTFDNPYAVELRENASFVGEGYFTGKLYQVSWYPGAVYHPDAASPVHGEVYEMTQKDRLLRILDEYEDISPPSEQSLYRRITIPVFIQNGQILSCWAYLYNQSVRKFPVISSGRFTGLT